jgi:predicted ester cyclase
MGRAREAVERLMTTYDCKDPAALVALYGPDALITRPGEGTMSPAAYARYFGVFVGAMPDFRHQLTNVVEEGSKAAFESVVTATFTGTLQTPNGPVPPTGNAIRFPEAGFIDVANDGTIVTDVSYADMSDLFVQLGLAPTPPPP